jgi:hypothetical protein
MSPDEFETNERPEGIPSGEESSPGDLAKTRIPKVLRPP